MEIRLVDPTSISNWDSLILQGRQPSLFYSQSWARVLMSSFNYRPLYLVCWQGGRILGLLPLMEVDSVLTQRRGVCVPFADSGEFARRDADLYRGLFERACALGCERKWRYIEVRGGKNLFPDTPASASYLTHKIDISRPIDSVRAGFHGHVRTTIRQAQKLGVEVIESRKSADMRIYFDLHCRTRKRHGVPPQPWHFFSDIDRYFVQRNKGKLLFATVNKKPVAGEVVLHFGRTAYEKYSASLIEYQHYRVNNLLQWEIIRRYANEGYSYVDLGRTSMNNHGLLRYKGGWGAEVSTTDYYRYRLPDGPFIQMPIREEAKLTDWMRKLPLPALRWIGHLAYRHMG